MQSPSRLLLIGAATLSVAAAPPADPHPSAPPPPQASYTAAGAIPFDLFRNSRIFLDGEVDGHPTPMMLDSGAAVSVIDKAFADRIHLPAGKDFQVRGAGGSVSGKILTGVDFTVGSLHLKNATVLVMDMAPIAAAVGRPIPVVLGRQAFDAGLVTIDFPHHRIGFSDRSHFQPPAKATRLELGERAYGVRTVKLSIGTLPPVDADLDLGNGSALVVSNALWKDDSQLASLRHATSQIGGVGGMKPARKATVPEVTLGGHRYFAVPASFNEDPKSLPVTGANVGIDMLKPFVATFDFSGNALFLSGPADVKALPRERAGVRFELAGHLLRAAYVSPDGPAALAGLKTDDQIVAVDGRKVDGTYYDRPDWTFGSAGRVVDLERSNGSHVRVKLSDYY